METTYTHADGAAQRFNAGTAPGHVMLTGTFEIRVDINVTQYAAEYGGSVEEELASDPVDSVRQWLLETVPDHLRAAVLVGVSDATAGAQGVILAEDK